ncbi:MAG: CinA family nicotinamide mononucleotide deamidase-related protein [Verrucomicrobiota bacterium]|nr:CinA family nicotinamide mononucleotide deamidase-related protein [Limisphaera sp.]MDW8382190.1 CinA family nicotinamide mononucleotide deamidase-related protein [Verrucomicrobiota bacterium]
MVTVELVHTGTELLTGARENKHARWLSQRLRHLGYTVVRHATVPDSAEAIQTAVAEALARADLVMVTGGLGATSDDRTREALASLTGCSLREDPDLLRELEAFYAIRGRTLPPRARVQALVPTGAIILPNRWGTAPGLAWKVDYRPLGSIPCGSASPGDQPTQTRWLVLLPGPTRELRPLFEEHVVPLLQRELPVMEEWIDITLRTVGLPESVVEERVLKVLGPLEGSATEVAFLAQPGQVDVCVRVRGPAPQNRLDWLENAIAKELGPAVFGRGDVSLEAVVLELLRSRGESLAVAESCTGGHLANRLTNVPGASAAFLAGWVTYSDAAKIACLGVDPMTLKCNGAVSEPVAGQMAEGARQRAGSTHGLAITGIAGPTGGTLEKPVGTVYIAHAGPAGVQVVRRFNPVDRLTFKELTSTQALDLLRYALTLPRQTA